VVLKI